MRAYGLGGLAISSCALLACTQNFDVFTDSGAASPGDAASSDARSEAVDAGGCNPSCTATAKTCAGGCRDAGAQCVAMCGSNQCRNQCNNARDNCIAKCRTDCTACTMDAGCGGACQQATNN